MNGTITFRDEFTINQLSEGVCELKDAMVKWDEVIVDIGEAKTVDIAAIQMLVAAKKECDKTGRKLVVKMSDAALKFLLSTGVNLS